MKMVAQPQTVFFHNTQLSIVEYNNQPYVPMKLVVEGMGHGLGLEEPAQKACFKSEMGYGQNDHPFKWWYSGDVLYSAAKTIWMV